MAETKESGLERKFCQVETGLSLIEGHRIEGYASLFGACDQGGDVVTKGAYAASLSKLLAAQRSVKMLWQHDPAAPIGVACDLPNASGGACRGQGRSARGP